MEQKSSKPGRSFDRRSERAVALEMEADAASCHRAMHRQKCGHEIDRGPDIAPVGRVFAKVAGGIFAVFVALLVIAGEGGG